MLNYQRVVQKLYLIDLWIFEQMSVYDECSTVSINI